MVYPLSVAPCETAEQLVGGVTGLGQSADGEVDGGAQGVGGGLKGIIVTRTRCPLLCQRSKQGRGGGGYFVQDMDEVQASSDHHSGGLRVHLGKGTGGRRGKRGAFMLDHYFVLDRVQT